MEGIEKLTEQELREAISRLKKRRTSDLKKALQKTKGSYIYKTLLGISRQNFFIKKESGQFSEKEVEILKKHNLIKG